MTTSDISEEILTGMRNTGFEDEPVQNNTN